MKRKAAPRIDGAESSDPRYRPLPRKALVVWQVENLVGAVAVATVGLVVLHAPFVDDSWQSWALPVLVGLALVTVVELAWLIPQRYRHYRYAILDDCIVVVRGRFLVRVSTFPLHQVLYVETRQGPLLRYFDLVRVQMGTIADPHSVGPLPQAGAAEVRRAVETRSRTP